MEDRIMTTAVEGVDETPEYVIIAGRIYPKTDYRVEGSPFKTNIVLHKRELYGVGDIKADLVMREELERKAAASED